MLQYVLLLLFNLKKEGNNTDRNIEISFIEFWSKKYGSLFFKKIYQRLFFKIINKAVL